jgi:uncharacterized lipoprotein YajG
MRFFRSLCIAAAAAVLFNLAGCATPSTSQAMTVRPGSTAAVNPKLKGAVAVGEVTGGKETSPLWVSKVDNAGFKKALTDSLAISGYLAADASQAKYSVAAELDALEQPFVGFTLDVKSSVNYKLSGPAGVRAYPIKATGTATVSDAFAAVERLRIANERSMLDNIKQFVNELSNFSD